MGIDYGLELIQRKENVMNHKILHAIQYVAQYLIDKHIDEFKSYSFWTCCELVERTIEHSDFKFNPRAVELILDSLRKEFMTKYMPNMELSNTFFITQYVGLVTESEPVTHTYQQKLQETRIEWLQFIINYGA